ncbi:hypothetical protein N7510_009614 [Penicillium lagena]|uniref:uncharacterized protein n=1 Tax=Penicillium lagena TaxID=94218 RepID=UPI0025421DA5|nr:uncharacterized protein N7510_009614 [Penicillium lagena]KAJ5604460.1 hypothetical protein N7510_009614 [Penicillium lagena]
MADPLSVLGTALSVISLGLQMREEIVSYCRAWRGIHQELQDVANKADGLEAPLEALREIIQETQLTDPKIAEDLQTKLGALRGGIERTRDLPESVRDKIRAKGKRAAYPFRKDMLRELANELDSIQINLHTTLHVLFMFLISQGVSLDSTRTQGTSGLDYFVGAVKLGDEEYRLLSRLIECGGVMTIGAASQSRISKENMRRVLRENEEGT